MRVRGDTYGINQAKVISEAYSYDLSATLSEENFGSNSQVTLQQYKMLEKYLEELPSDFELW